jgi:hypothetical protein
MDAAFGTLAAEGFHVSDPSGRLLLLAAVGLDPFKHDLTSPEAIKALETAFLNVRAKLRRTLRVTGRLVLADAFVANPLARLTSTRPVALRRRTWRLSARLCWRRASSARTRWCCRAPSWCS